MFAGNLEHGCIRTKCGQKPMDGVEVSIEVGSRRGMPNGTFMRVEVAKALDFPEDRLGSIARTRPESAIAGAATE